MKTVKLKQKDVEHVKTKEEATTIKKKPKSAH